MNDMEHSQPLEKRLAAVIGNYTDAAGNIDYSAIEMATDVFEYVDGLPDYDLSRLRGRREQIAFWINTYNMLSIAGILKAIKRNPGFVKTGHRGMLHKARFFFTDRHIVGGEKLSLDAIEKKLRLELKEPRVHFALVCGSESCPPLKGGLYSGDGLDRELDMAAKIFIGSPKGVVLDKENGTIHLSKIFRWYKRDFGPDETSMLRFIAQYHPQGDYIAREAGRLKVVYMRYDWSLNQAGPRSD